MEGLANEVIEVDLSGASTAMPRADPPGCSEAGGGAIVNMASILNRVERARRAPRYVSAKHGLLGLRRSAPRSSTRSRGIRTNAVGPGYIDTPLLSGLSKDMIEMLIALHPIGRLGRSEEVAELVVWLSSERASFVSGSYYPVDGGYLAR